MDIVCLFVDFHLRAKVSSITKMCPEWVEEIVASLSHNGLFCTSVGLTFHIILLLDARCTKSMHG